MLNPLNLEQKKNLGEAFVFLIFYGFLGVIFFAILRGIAIYSIQIDNASKVVYFIVYLAEIVYILTIGAIILNKKKLFKKYFFIFLVFLAAFIRIVDPHLMLISMGILSFLTTTERKDCN